AAEEDVGMTKVMTLFDKFLDQGQRLAGTGAPNDVVARPDYSGKIEIARFDFLRHLVLLASAIRAAGLHKAARPGQKQRIGHNRAPVRKQPLRLDAAENRQVEEFPVAIDRFETRFDQPFELAA